MWFYLGCVHFDFFFLLLLFGIKKKRVKQEVGEGFFFFAGGFAVWCDGAEFVFGASVKGFLPVQEEWRDV